MTPWEYVIREMEFDDISPVTEIEAQNFSRAEIWNGTGFLTHLMREDALYVVAVREMPEKTAKHEDAEEEWQEPDILGYAGILMVPDEADITKVSVRPDAQRRGIGEALLCALAEKAPEHGVARIFLEVRKSNLAAVRLYEKCGYETVGERKRYYADPVEDALVMKKELNVLG